MSKASLRSIVPMERIEHTILVIRGRKVLLDRDLAILYEVESRAIVQAIKRNQDHFPDDFVFQLTQAEEENLKSQNVISRYSGHGGRRSHHFAFTEQGIAMLSSVLKSKRAALVNVEIMRTFVKLREMIASHEKLAQKLILLEERYDSQFKEVFDAIRKLMEPLEDPKPERRIGFRID